MSYALITGAAKGIGASIALELAKLGKGLILIDIDQRGLEKTAAIVKEKYNVDTITFVQDLTKENAVETIYQKTKWYHPYLNIVISNAGYGINAPFKDAAIDEQLGIVEVNIKTQLKIAHAFIPVLSKFPRSYLLNVGSTTCYQSVPYLSVYAASKSFVISFTRSLRYELKNTSISVSCLIPGPTDTAFVARAGMKEHTLKTAQKFNMPPATVAKIAVRGLFHKKAEIIPGFINKLNSGLIKFLPKIWVERVAANIYNEKTEIHVVKTNMKYMIE